MAATETTNKWRGSALAVAHLEIIEVAESSELDVHDVELDVNAVPPPRRHAPHTHAVGRVVTRELRARDVTRGLHAVETAI